MQIFIVGLLFLRSRLVFNIGPLGSPTSRGEFETKPGRNLDNQGASFPPGKQKQSFSHPGPFLSAVHQRLVRPGHHFQLREEELLLRV